MDRRLMLKYCAEEQSNSGVPLVLLSYKHGAEAAPYLECIMLASYSDSESSLHPRDVEYVDALMQDIYEASNESREAALLLLSRLEAICFGPIRCSRVS